MSIKIGIGIRIGGGYSAFTFDASEAPTALSLVTGVASAPQINLSWTDNSSLEDWFSIERSTDGVTYSQIATVVAGVTVYSNTGLTAGVLYYYRVRAYKGSAYSGYSNVASTNAYSAGEVYIMAANTLSWLDFTNTAGIVKDGANLVSVWKHKLGYTEGLNVVTNYHFDVATGWILNAGLSIGSDRLIFTNATGGSSYAYRNENVLTVGRTYKVVFEISGYSSGSMQVQVGGGGISPAVSANGTYTFYLACVGDQKLYISAIGVPAATLNVEYITCQLINTGNVYQNEGTKQPLYSATGILFDGADNFLRGKFTSAQPTFIYAVVKQKTWTSADPLLDGYGAANIGSVRQGAGATPRIYAYAGSASGDDANLAVDTWAILRVCFNGANSKLQVNNNAAVTGNFGASNMDGLTLAGLATGFTAWGNIEYKEVVVRNNADSGADETAVYNYLATKYGLPTI